MLSKKICKLCYEISGEKDDGWHLCPWNISKFNCRGTYEKDHPECIACPESYYCILLTERKTIPKWCPYELEHILEAKK
jgi:hypothetical protein